VLLCPSPCPVAVATATAAVAVVTRIGVEEGTRAPAAVLALGVGWQRSDRALQQLLPPGLDKGTVAASTRPLLIFLLTRGVAGSGGNAVVHWVGDTCIVRRVHHRNP
jgi:hypothetical protein